MNDLEFSTAQTLLISAAEVLRGLDLDDFIGACERAETVAPYLDPTLYLKNRHAGDPLGVLKELAVAGRKFAALLPTMCRVCGCTDEKACDGGCAWVAPGLCSSCRPTSTTNAELLVVER